MRAALVALLCALLVPAASALGREERRIELDGVELVATCAWPGEAQKGYFPIRVELTNGREEEARVDVRARHMFGLDLVERRVRLAPGERIAFDFLCRGEELVDEEYAIELRGGGAIERTQPLGPGETTRRERKIVLALEHGPVDAERTARWNAAMGTRSCLVEPALFADSPEEAAAYSSLDAVLLDTARGLPPEEALAPLLAWTRLGGVLMLHGPLASQLARESRELGAWLEPRFLAAEARRGCRVYLCGQGQLLVQDDSELDLDALEEAMEAPGWVPGAGDSRAERHEPASWPTRGLPVRVLAAILVVFALVIGPVNFLAVKKLGRPVLLLVTVPGIALFWGLLLLLYGVFAQGLDVKVTRSTWTLLDQRAHRASSAEVRRLFAGLSPGPGLRPAAGTGLFVERGAGRTGGDRFDQRFRVEQAEEGALWSADYLPVRQVAPQLLLRDAAARGRIELARRGEALEATNALGASVERLYVRRGGAWHFLEAPLADGASATLAPAAEEDVRRACGEPVRAILGREAGELPEDCFLALLDRSPFTDPCGIELNEVAGTHALLGVLEPAAEDAR